MLIKAVLGQDFHALSAAGSQQHSPASVNTAAVRSFHAAPYNHAIRQAILVSGLTRKISLAEATLHNCKG